MHFKIHIRVDDGREPNSGDGVEAWDLLLLLDLVSEAADFQALHLDDSPGLLLFIQPHSRGGADYVLAEHCRGQSRFTVACLRDY